jgi:hypothetical protein
VNDATLHSHILGITPLFDEHRNVAMPLFSGPRRPPVERREDGSRRMFNVIPT